MAGNSALLFKPFYNCFIISYPRSLVCERVEGKPMPFGLFLCHPLSLKACPSWSGCLAAPDSAYCASSARSPLLAATPPAHTG